MIAAVLLTCAANIAPATLSAVIRVESSGQALAIHDNATGRSYQPQNVNAAISLARRLVAQGHKVDAGLVQVDSANWSAVGLDASSVFDPCANIRAGGTILTADYAIALQTHSPGQTALKVALSLYNTGTFDRGFSNGYVARYYGPLHVPAVNVHLASFEPSHGDARRVPDHPSWTAQLLARLSAPTTVAIPTN
ncbi:MAG TPA: lytic transglycosylase domain-containing protein [Stellaceae bacterium]|nr:lytic transglycosylase domain-containing protein [Stellaceae bacterium]